MRGCGSGCILFPCSIQNRPGRYLRQADGREWKRRLQRSFRSFCSCRPLRRLMPPPRTTPSKTPAATVGKTGRNGEEHGPGKAEATAGMNRRTGRATARVRSVRRFSRASGGEGGAGNGTNVPLISLSCPARTVSQQETGRTETPAKNEGRNTEGFGGVLEKLQGCFVSSSSPCGNTLFFTKSRLQTKYSTKHYGLKHAPAQGETCPD